MQRKVREQDILYVMQLLEEGLTFDESPKLSIRVNNQFRQCIRCEAQTQGKEWTLDIYGKHFFYLMIPPSAPCVQDNVRSLLLHMQAHLLR